MLKHKVTSFLDAALIFVAVALVLFITIMTVIYCKIGSVPDSLIEMVRDIFVAEITAGGIIQIAKERRKIKAKERAGESQDGEKPEESEETLHD